MTRALLLPALLALALLYRTRLIGHKFVVQAAAIS